ncbi:MAG TPA: hypothetical protein PLT37_01540 [Kiritimatiellia bacterium]|jgi:hypothetical protein|nr:hypothetical protein [Kiritimatiellia bacterium]MBP9571472.1 hypothetical protein [Kiritimatiellia bacterium]HQF19909.1 hypothetical protein [Kiritimatiellia bacterium]HQG73803.1 hypothetical protein [Kiritimatiellia bacterium]HXK78557.1 hypothetical protein [Kiritimatiellia bacterium]
MDTTMTMETKPNCVRYDCAACNNNKCDEVMMDYPCQIAGLLPARTAKRMPRTREDFRRAALWLARQAAKAGNALSAVLAGPAPDDAENGICIGYRDGRDR